MSEKNDPAPNNMDDQLAHAHRVFSDGHETRRQQLLDQLDRTLDENESENPINKPSTTRRWLMRSTLGLAATIAFAGAVIWMGVGVGPGTASIAWAGVRENIENTTAMHYQNEILILDAEGKQIQMPTGKMESWIIEDGRSRTVNLNSQGEPTNETITGHEATLLLSYAAEHAMLTTSHFYPQQAQAEGAQGIDDSMPSSPLEMILQLTDEHAHRVGEAEIDGISTIEFQIEMEDVVAFHMKESGAENGVKVDSAFGGSIEQMLTLPPLRLWVGVDSGLPVRMDMPMVKTIFRGMIDIPEGGQVIGRFDFLGWNEEVDPAVFEIKIPQGWALDRGETILLGKDSNPDDSQWVPTGLPLAPGVMFELLDAEENIVATEEHLLVVTSLTHRTGYLAGGAEDAWDKLVIKVQFTEEFQQRINEALGDEDSAQWSFRLGNAFEGNVRATRNQENASTPDNVTLGELTIDGLTPDRFIEACLTAH